MVKSYRDAIKYSGLNVNEEVSKISLIGSGIQSYPESVRNVLKILTEHEINVLLLFSSEIKLTIFVHEKDEMRAMRILHETFIN